MNFRQADCEKTVAFLLVVLAALFVGWVRVHFSNEYAPASLEKLMHGTALTPFQYRWLAPFTLRLLSDLLTQDLALLVHWYETVCFMAGVWAIFLFGRATGLTSGAAFAAAFSLFFLIPFFFVFQPLGRLYYPYDSLSIVFCGLTLWAIARQRPWFFLVIFGLGLLNRESLVLVFLLAVFEYKRQDRLSRSRYRLFVFLGVALIVLAKLLASSMFADNPGAGGLSFDHDILHKGWPKSLETSRVYTNFMLFSRLDSAVTTASVFGFLWILPVFGRERIQNRALRHSIALLPLSLLIMFFVGNLNEPRIFCELSPIVLVSVAHLFALQTPASTDFA